MSSITIVILHAFLVHPHAKELPGGERGDAQDWNSMDSFAHALADELASKVVNRLHSKWHVKLLFVNSTDLDSTTLGKPGHVAISQPVHAVHMIRRPQFSRLRGTSEGKEEGADLNPFNPSGAWNPFVRTTTLNKKKLSGSEFKMWPDQFTSLVDRGLTAVTCDEALKMMQDQSAVLVDPRLEEIFQSATIEGAVNVPLFQRLAGSSLFDKVKRVANAAIGQVGKERNPNFASMARERIPVDRPVIVACDRGGDVSMPDPNIKGALTGNATFSKFTDGDRYTLSLRAAYQLYEAGFTKVYIMRRGMNQWQIEGLPMCEPGT